MTDSPTTVIKVGGSLFDLSDLGQRLRRWLDELLRPRVLLVPGGGAVVDAIRTLDRLHGLGEEKSHWLALRALSVNAHLLADLFVGGGVVESLSACSVCWQEGRLPVLDAHAFARADENSPGRLPHSWEVTSDSIAARVAVVAGARQLVLLKSVSLPAGVDWRTASGLVDRHVAEVVGEEITVRVVNLRDART